MPFSYCNFFVYEPQFYDLNDEDYHKEFRKCMFKRRLNSGTYLFKNVNNGDFIRYTIKNRMFVDMNGVVNGVPVKFSIYKNIY